MYTDQTKRLKKYKEENELTIEQVFVRITRGDFTPSFDTVRNWLFGRHKPMKMNINGLERFLVKNKY